LSVEVVSMSMSVDEEAARRRVAIGSALFIHQPRPLPAP
jgi:hypothetical protein